MRSIARWSWFTLGLALAALAGCSSSNSASSGKGMSQGCTVSDDCAAPLQCLTEGREPKQCTLSCAGAHAGGNDAVCLGATANSLCDDGTSSCRVACTNGEPCPSGSHCAALGIPGDTRKACYRD